ncbi:MAG: P-type conjugative transfer protein TrbJ [Rhizobiaceae bacterium]|nr:P-type conjugative transfer protein TrbJ [Rhizobiaceae bacterium]
MNSFKQGLLSALIALSIGCSSLVVNAPTAYAITVFDPANYSQNLLTAVRNLQQISNQINQLTNQAQMLVNQAKNLTQLPMSIASDLRSSLQRVDQLIQNARNLSYSVSAITAEYQRIFPESYNAGTTVSRIIQDAEDAWKLAREGFKHSLEVQAVVVGQLRTDATTLNRIIAESQSAVGNLQAVQAGNQLTALVAKQSMQLQSLLAASARAAALDGARALAAREQGRARFQRFLGDRSAYTPR